METITKIAAALFLILVLALLLFSCCKEADPLPVITKQSDVIYFTYSDVQNYITQKKTRLISAGQIVGTEYFILVFADNQKCYIDRVTYDKLF